MPIAEQLSQQKTDFRLAFDFIKRQTAKIEAYADETSYFQQAFADLHQVCSQGASPLLQNIMLDCYVELENIWKANHQ